VVVFIEVLLREVYTVTRTGAWNIQVNAKGARATLLGSNRIIATLVGTAVTKLGLLWRWFR
jgi:hypothetical protein